jgi:hypothetical protein
MKQILLGILLILCISCTSSKEYTAIEPRFEVLEVRGSQALIKFSAGDKKKGPIFIDWFNIENYPKVEKGWQGVFFFMDPKHLADADK